MFPVMRRTIATLTMLALAACKGDDRPAAPPPRAQRPPAPIHVAPAPAASTPAPESAPDPDVARRELDHLDQVIAHAKDDLAAAHTDAERVKARTLINAMQKRRDALAQRLAQPVPTEPN
jgi:hypothetical protein